MTVQEIVSIHPVPWRHGVHAGNQIVVIDSMGKVVELFTMLDFILNVTSNMATESNAKVTEPATASL